MLMNRIHGYPTLATNDPAQPSEAERRRAPRKSVFLRATIYPVDVFCDVRIRDVSATGLMGETDVELAIGQTLHITIDEQAYHAGRVKWTRERQFGVDLPNASALFANRSIDVDHGSREGHQPRAPRTVVDVMAHLVGGRPPRPAMIRNVSASGMLLDTGPGLKPGQLLVVRAGNAPPIYGRVQWSEEGRIGFKARHRMSCLTIACDGD